MTGYLLDRPLYCRRCGRLLTLLPTYAPEDYVLAVIRSLGSCPRCGRTLDAARKELHNESYFTLRSIIWKLTHPWRLFK